MEIEYRGWRIVEEAVDAEAHGFAMTRAFAVYDDLGWKPVNRYEDKELKRLIKHIDTARSSLKRVGIVKKDDKKVERELIVIDELLNKLEEYLSNDREHN